MFDVCSLTKVEPSSRAMASLTSPCVRSWQSTVCRWWWSSLRSLLRRSSAATWNCICCCSLTRRSLRLSRWSVRSRKLRRSSTARLVTGTEALCIAPPTRRPRAHHRVNPYPDACWQNETEMFSDHNETRPSIAVVLAITVFSACFIITIIRNEYYHSAISQKNLEST